MLFRSSLKHLGQRNWGIKPIYRYYVTNKLKEQIKTVNLSTDIDPKSIPLSGSPDLSKALKSLSVKIPKGSKMPSRPKPPPEKDFEEKFIKGGSGHGGQKINKTNSKVQLTHKDTGIVITCQATRSREQNRKIARQLLAEKLDVMENGILSRKGIVSAAKQVKRQRSDKKKRRKYKLLDQEKGKDNTEENVVIDNDIVTIEEK